MLPLIKIPFLLATPIPVKYDNGIDIAIAQGQEITKKVSPLYKLSLYDISIINGKNIIIKIASIIIIGVYILAAAPTKFSVLAFLSLAFSVNSSINDLYNVIKEVDLETASSLADMVEIIGSAKIILNIRVNVATNLLVKLEAKIEDVKEAIQKSLASDEDIKDANINALDMNFKLEFDYSAKSQLFLILMIMFLSRIYVRSNINIG